MPAEEYFGQFIEKEKDLYGKVHYSHLTSGDYLILRKEASGLDIKNRLEIRLLDNHTFEAEYEEARYRNLTSELILRVPVKGNWRVEGVKLVLDGLGVGEGFRETINSKVTNKVWITFSDNFDAPSARNIILSLELSWYDHRFFLRGAWKE